MNHIKKQELIKWVGLIGEDHNLIAPIKKDGVLLYQQIQSPEDIVWNDHKPVNSIKDVFFPQTEVIAEMSSNGQGFDLHEVISDEKTILLNVRPCDSRGMLCLNQMFINAFPPDIYYSARRKNAVVIGLACEKLGENCFCTSMGGGPNDSSGMDVMLTAVDDGFIVEVLTAKGQGIVHNLALVAKELELPANPELAPINNPDEALLKQSFHAKVWSEQAERCLSCRICAYVCPTCRCFDVRDQQLANSNGEKKISRIRCWDSCAGEAYRKIAGGHNPRAVKSDRLRNRVMCKYYYYPQQYGMTACVGCGRCIDSCPVHIDITEILYELQEEMA